MSAPKYIDLKWFRVRRRRGIRTFTSSGLQSTIRGRQYPIMGILSSPSKNNFHCIRRFEGNVDFAIGERY